MSSNFEFLKACDKAMAQLSRQAESYVYTDPESCLFKLRLMIETMAKRLAQMHLPELVSEDLAVMLSRLERVGALDRSRADVMHAIRRDGNQAVHGGRTPIPTALRRLREAHSISRWFVQSMSRDGRKVRSGPFVEPAKPAAMSGVQRETIEQAEKLEDRIEQERATTRRALMLYEDHEEAAREAGRLRQELEALDRVASEAGEPLVDKDSVMLIMAMEIEHLLEHPRLGLTTREAKKEAERQFEAARSALEARERSYRAEREALIDAIESAERDA